MRLYFGSMTIAAILATMSGAALSWDGSYYLYEILSTQEPFIAHNRLITLPISYVLLVVSQFSSSTDLLQMIFTSYYATLPVIFAWLAWRVVRDEKPSLFVWSAISTGIILLPGQFNYVSEAISVLHIFFPLWFAVLLGGKAWRTWVIIICAGLLVATHPFAVGLLIIALLGWSVFGYRKHGLSVRFWMITLVLAAYEAVALYILYIDSNSYSQYGLSGQGTLYALSVQPLIVYIVLLFATLILIATFAYKVIQITMESARLHSIIIVGLVVLCSAILILWAVDRELWWQAAEYRFLSVFVLIPVYLFSFIEVYRTSGEILDTHQLRLRLNITILSGLIFVVIIGIQSVIWMNIKADFENIAVRDSSACIPKSLIQGELGYSPLSHWSIISFSLLEQGKIPHYIVQGDNRCSTNNFNSEFELAEWQVQTWEMPAGWFDTTILQRALSSDPACWYQDGSGWYPTEYEDGIPFRWNAGAGSIIVESNEKLDITIGGEILSTTSPTTIDVLVDGEQYGNINISNDSPEAFNIQLEMVDSRKTITLISNAPLITNDSDTRPLSVLVSSLSMSHTDGEIMCSD